MVGRHLRLRAGYLEARPGDERGHEAVCRRDPQQAFEQDVARVVVAPDERVAQQVGHGQRNQSLPVLLQHGTPRVGVELVAPDGQQGVERPSVPVEAVAKSQCLVELEHAHHGIDAPVVDDDGIGAADDDGHSHLARAGRCYPGDAVGEDIGQWRTTALCRLSEGP